MYCPNCGKELPEGTKFCPDCGAKQSEMSKNTGFSNYNGQEQRQTETWGTQTNPGVWSEPVQPASEKRKTLIVLISCIAVGILAIAALVVLLLNGMGKSEDLSLVVAKVNSDGTAYILLPENGDCLVIDEDVNIAVITADRKHVVVHLNDGTLYITDKKLSKRQIVATDVYGLRFAQNEGIFYTTNDDTGYRFLFSDKEPLSLGSNENYTFADNTMSLVYCDYVGNIYTLASDSTRRVQVCSAAEDVELLGVSDNGQIAVWCANESGTLVLYLAENGMKEKLGEVDHSYSLAYALFSEDNKMVTVADMFCDSMWIKKAGEDTVKVKLGNDCSWPSMIWTESGEIEYVKASRISSLYVGVDGDEGTDIFYIRPDGSRERLLEDVDNCYIEDGYIFYTDVDLNLYYAKLKGSSISGKTKVASDVLCFDVPANGKYVYYMQNCENGTGDLYCCKTGGNSSQKVAKGVSYYDSGYGYGWTRLTFSSDGATVLYYMDMENIEDTYRYSGTMMMWSYGDKAGTKLADDVIVFSSTSSLPHSEINPKSFVFSQLKWVDSLGNFYTDLMYFDGKKVTTLAVNVA